MSTPTLSFIFLYAVLSSMAGLVGCSDGGSMTSSSGSAASGGNGTAANVGGAGGMANVGGAGGMATPGTGGMGTPGEADPYDLTAGGTRTIPCSINWPTAPTTTQIINVTAGSISQLQAAVATSGARVVVPAGSYDGNITISGDDVDIVNAA